MMAIPRSHDARWAVAKYLVSTMLTLDNAKSVSDAGDEMVARLIGGMLYTACVLANRLSICPGRLANSAR